ncbi:methyl-accepting chemotaxis protein [Marinobacterium sp. AK62]|uniref:Methyl-accepting chemotaxis protein n=1 Tax=Marinobacterium alkalitolerans TaxID=1542925 RepID=A0ABS3Z676_9GAMM|nr:methyl-accepting chemotaxis protein [Marinobacterium alkalitolerans]MBP0047212.1 methyl-accepting chemotaxis protein [Marinobacterium alkalitolerans]
MTIKQKLGTLIGLILFGFIGMGAIFLYTLERYGTLVETSQVLTEIETDKLELRRHEKDFLARLDVSYAERFADRYERFQSELDTMEGLLDDPRLQQNVSTLRQQMELYRSSFDEVVGIRTKIGLDETSGLRGALRNAVHEAEEQIRATRDTQLLSDLLMLRRHEKDFLLRLNPKYLDRFNKQIEAIQVQIDIALLPEEATTLKAKLARYQRDFTALFEGFQTLGFSSDEGLMGQMRSAVHTTTEDLDTLEQHLTQLLASEEQRLTLIAMLALAIFITLNTLSALLLGRSILKPITGLANTMSRASEEHDLTLRFDASGKDEVSRMAGDFNRMMDRFRDLIARVAGTSSQLAAAAEQLSATTSDTSRGLSTQQQQVLQVATAVQEMESSMQEIAGSTESTANTARQAQQDASDSTARVSGNIEALKELATKARQTADVVEQLRDNSSQIGTMLDVIKDIAEQTNLLALNASIEAARAGEQGRGFSVVADEVRTLAARSQTSAAEIEKLVHSLQEQTEHVSQLMQTSVADSEASAERAGETIEALDTITAGANSIVDMTSQVASATEEQASVAAEITRNIDHIRSIMENANEQVAQNADASQTVAQQAADLQNAVGSFKT